MFLLQCRLYRLKQYLGGAHHFHAILNQIWGTIESIWFYGFEKVLANHFTSKLHDNLFIAQIKKNVIRWPAGLSRYLHLASGSGYVSFKCRYMLTLDQSIKLVIKEKILSQRQCWNHINPISVNENDTSPYNWIFA